MPSSTVKQAKVMSALAHGWHPTGKAAKIPKKVAVEFHAADAGHKYGKGMHHKFNGGKVGQALHTMRKYAKKADGGEVDDTPPVDQPRLDVYRGMPPVSPNLGLSQDLMKKSPLEGRETGQVMETHDPTLGEKVSTFLKGKDTPFYAPRADLVDKAAQLNEYTPWGQAKTAGENIAKGEFKEAAASMMPGYKAAKAPADFSFALLHAAENAFGADQVGKSVAKVLKGQYGKDIAEKAVDVGLSPEQIENLKTYMSPGAQANFDKHYKKVAPKKEPSFAPALWNTPEMQATKPNLTVVPKQQDDPAGKAMAAIEQALGVKKSQPFIPGGEPFGVPSDQFGLKGSMVPADHPAWDSFNQWHDMLAKQPINLNGGQKASVAYWGSQDGYKDINESLRGNIKGSNNAVAAIEYLDSAMETNSLKENASVWRGLYGPQAEQLRNLKEGDTFFNKGYTATTVDPRQSTHYGAKDSIKYGKKDDDANILLNYHLPAGHPSLYVSHPDAGNYIQSERELLLPHGGQYKIIGTEKIKSPVWHYLGHLTDPNPHEFTVYHVVPTTEGKATQLDVGKSMPEPFAPKAAKAAEESQAKFKDAFEQTPYTPHNEDEFKPTGKDSDIEDFYKHQEEHAVGPEWEPNPNEINEAHAEHDLGFVQDEHPDNKNYNAAFAKHIKFVDWKSYKPRQADPAPESFIRNRDKIIAAGGNPDVALLKGGHKETYPKETPDKSQSYSSQTKGLFLGDQLKSSNQYGTHVLPYVGVPRGKVPEIDFKDFVNEMGGEYKHWAHASNPHFVSMIAAVRKQYNPEMLIVHNVKDVFEGGSKAATQYIVFKPNILRAPSANFDPSKWHLKLPLAGIAGLTAGAGIYSYGDDKSGNNTKGMKQGGTVAKNKDPEDHEFINFSKGGLIDSSVPGRTDKVPMKVPPGSYVLPADIPSALGEGNTKAGSDVLSKMFTHSAYGLKPMTQKAQKFHFDGFKKLADGGEADHTPIIAAGGEYIIHPDIVKHVGEGNMSQGHRLLDKFVLHTRAQHIKTLKKLKGPKK
jgi:hypothetical protein